MERKKDKESAKKPDTKPEKIPDTTSGKIPDNQPDKKMRIAVVLLAFAVLGCAVFFGIHLLNTSPSAPAQGTGSNTLTVYYFYGAECPHCHNVTPYVKSLRQKYPDINFQILEIWHDETNNALSRLLNHKLNQKQYGVPEAIVGNVVLSGEDEITTNLEGAILGQQGNLTGSSQLAAIPVSGSSDGVNASIPVTYYYGAGCSHCEKVKPIIADLEARYPDLRLTRLEVYNNADNRQNLINTAWRLGYKNPSLPFIVIGNTALEGEENVTSRFETEILAEKQRLASVNTSGPVNQIAADPGIPVENPGLLSLPLVVGAALVDSTNPCGLSVLVFLLISMAAAGGRKRILLVGGVYIAAMFLFHLLVGIGLFSAMAISGLAKPFSIIGGTIALILGIVTLADVLRNKETYILSIPESGKGLLGTYIRKATLPAAFVLGILAGILGFSCTGGIYISILGLMGRDMTVMAGLPWLVLYNIVFVLPLVLVTLLVAYGVSPERADRWRSENKRTVRVLVGIILVALGLIILSGWFG
mgnify:CR=1 FL=1